MTNRKEGTALREALMFVRPLHEAAAAALTDEHGDEHREALCMIDAALKGGEDVSSGSIGEPPGWQLVPTTPSDAMLDAATEKAVDGHVPNRQGFAAYWRAMLSWAPRFVSTGGAASQMEYLSSGSGSIGGDETRGALDNVDELRELARSLMRLHDDAKARTYGHEALWEAAPALRRYALRIERANSAQRIERLKDAIEGECDGLGITDAPARAILEYVGGFVSTGEPSEPDKTTPATPKEGAQSSAYDVQAALNSPITELCKDCREVQWCAPMKQCLIARLAKSEKYHAALSTASPQHAADDVVSSGSGVIGGLKTPGGR